MQCRFYDFKGLQYIYADIASLFSCNRSGSVDQQIEQQAIWWERRDIVWGIKVF